MYANVDINFLSDNIKEQMEIEYCRIKKCLENKKEIFLSKNI
jgi:hypothetical protein